MKKDRKADRHLSRKQHVHLFNYCLICGVYLDCPCYTRGRPAKYCSNSHKQWAYRDRQAELRSAG